MWQIISTYIIGIITIIGVFFFGKIVLDKKIRISKIKIIITLLFSALLNTITYLYFEGTPKTLIMAIIDIVFYIFVFKIEYKKSIFLTFLYMILLMITDILELLFVNKVLGLSVEQCFKNFIGSIIGNICVVGVFLLITFFIKNVLRRLINTKIENNKKIIIYSLLIFVCIESLVYIIAQEFKLNNKIFIYIISIIVLLIVLFSLIKQTIENKSIINKYDKLLEFMTSYEKEIEKIRVLRHETKNEFLTIKSKIIDKEKNKEIIKYINNILKDDYEIKYEMYAKFGYLPANGIKGLCYFKTQEAVNKGIKVFINISQRVEKSAIYKLNIKQNRDLGKILGVFLDNAIEGALDSEEKEFGIEVYINMNNECEFIICNSCNEKINLENNGKERISTKGKNRGHGLILVNHLINNNNNIFSLETKIIRGLYVQTLKIKKPTSKN